MYKYMMGVGPTYRFDMVLTCSSDSATSMLKLLGRSAAVATVGLMLIASLFWSAQHSSQIIPGFISPETIAIRSEHAPAAEQELQTRVNAYLQDLAARRPLTTEP